MRRLLFALLVLLMLPGAGWAQSSRHKQGVMTADEATVELNVSGLASASVQLSGTFVADVFFEISNGGAWVVISCDSPTVSGGTVTSGTAAGLWFCPVAGVEKFRTRVDAYTSGRVEVDLEASSGGRSSTSSVSASGTIDTNVVNIPSMSCANCAPTSSPTFAVDPCGIVTTASTNATSCANATANLYGVLYAINPTATPAFMRFINTAGTPTCTDAIVIPPVPIPAYSAAGVYGGLHLPFLNPIHFTTGIGVCVSGAADGTTNAPAAIMILIGVKE